MIAVLIRSARSAADTGRELFAFIDAVVQDMRQTRKQLEDQYGPLGF